MFGRYEDIPTWLIYGMILRNNIVCEYVIAGFWTSFSKCISGGSLRELRELRFGVLLFRVHRVHHFRCVGLRWWDGLGMGWQGFIWLYMIKYCMYTYIYMHIYIYILYGLYIINVYIYIYIQNIFTFGSSKGVERVVGLFLAPGRCLSSGYQPSTKGTKFKPSTKPPTSRCRYFG